MQLLRLAEVPSNPRDRVFRYSRARAAIGATVVAAVAVAALLYGRLQGAWLPYHIAAVLFILLLIFHNLVTARFRPSNWLLRMTEHGLFVKFRSYLNGHFDAEDLTVVFIPYSEIRSARAVTEQRELPDQERDRRGTTTRTRQVVELELDGNSTELAKGLARERERLFGKIVVGAGRISTRYQHLPVQLATPASLRIEWGVVPSARSLLDALTRHTLVQNSAAVAKDFANLEQLTREEQEMRLIELVHSGDTISAVALVRRLYSYDLTAAKRFVEDLARRQPDR